MIVRVVYIACALAILIGGARMFWELAPTLTFAQGLTAIGMLGCTAVVMAALAVAWWQSRNSDRES